MVVVFNFGNDSNVDDQWLRITNQKRFDIEVLVTANNTDTLRVPCNQSVTYDVGYLTRGENGTAALLLNSSSEFMIDGLYHHVYENHVLDTIVYSIMPTDKLGKEYITRLFFSDNDVERKCVIGALHDDTKITIHHDDGNAIDYIIPQKLETLEVQISDGNYSLNISANKCVAVFCGAKSPTNVVRFHAPAVDICGTQFSIPCYSLTSPKTSVRRRIIRIYTLDSAPFNSSISFSMNGSKRVVEVDEDRGFNITSASVVCVGQSVRRWDVTNSTFIDGDYEFIQSSLPPRNNGECTVSLDTKSIL